MAGLDAREQISKELDPAERLIWSGIPRQGIIFRSSDAFFIPFSLMWGGFAVFWEASALAEGAPLFFAAWGIPFVVIGLYMIMGRFFVDKKLRSQTAYGVTDERVLIISGIFSRSVKSLQLRTLSDVSVDERRDGSGTITFGPTHPMARWSGGMAWPGMGSFQSPAFELVPGVKDLYRKIRDAQEGRSWP